MDDINPRPLSLDFLLDGIDGGRIVLPDFQRDFDWSDSDVVSLIATILSAWPAGSLLIMKGLTNYLAVREFESAPPKSAATDYVVLDGQQRLTALYHAFRNTGDTVYACDVSTFTGEMPTVDTIEAAIRVIPRKEWDSQYPLTRQGAEKLVPLFALSSASEFFEWRDSVFDAMREANIDGPLSLFTRAYKDVLGNVNHYMFPSVVLESNQPPQAIARIFERVNRTGRRLGTFDLLVARSYSTNWNLRERWETARNESQYIDHFVDDDGTSVLQVISMRMKKDVRQPAMLDLSSDEIQSNWDDAVRGFDSALEFVLKSGVENPKWLPHKALILPLASVAIDHDLDGHRSLLESWFWARSFSHDYDVASSTKAVSDYQELQDAVVKGSPISRSMLTLDELRSFTRKQHGGLWRAFMSLLMHTAPKDPLSGENLLGRDDIVVVSLADRESPTQDHLRIISQLLCERATVRAAGRYKLAAAIDLGASAQTTTQFLPDTPGTSDDYLNHRTDLVGEYLQASFGSVLDVVARQ
ncbi:DUF262 domain-containing protein [Kribbella turkmenica]|uniref:DUF262 domain-containing protein n=1 Tax=Kribbella turkmenica TaxID=2530375 RepID=A0A4R4WT41_9ACTN|nr:DUF262 domain-containing protein [Kribbella turkmenica]TDD20770.1 DUF262 domain-containing protein [Kribbella turkmenica]